jgi:hypothetical protein
MIVPKMIIIVKKKNDCTTKKKDKGEINFKKKEVQTKILK